MPNSPEGLIAELLKYFPGESECYWNYDDSKKAFLMFATGDSATHVMKMMRAIDDFGFVQARAGEQRVVQAISEQMPG